MKMKIITDNASEKIAVTWDGERFTLVKSKRLAGGSLASSGVIILNPKEMLDLIKFAGKLGRDDG